MDFDLEWLLAEEKEEESSSSSFLIELAFKGFSAMSSGRLLTASDIAASAPFALTGVGRSGSGSGSGLGSSGSGEGEGAAGSGLLQAEGRGGKGKQLCKGTTPMDPFGKA